MPRIHRTSLVLAATAAALLTLAAPAEAVTLEAQMLEAQPFRADERSDPGAYHDGCILETDRRGGRALYRFKTPGKRPLFTAPVAAAYTTSGWLEAVRKLWAAMPAAWKAEARAEGRSRYCDLNVRY